LTGSGRKSIAKKTKTAIALQGGGALGAYALGALKWLYESEPGFQPSTISGVSIGAFTAAIVASHPRDPIPALQAFWDELTVLDSPFIPDFLESRLARFGNRAFYYPRLDYFALPLWTSFYNLSPIRKTLERYVDEKRIASREVRLVVTATDIKSGEIKEFSNDEPAKPLTIDHLIASGSLPPSYPPKVIDNVSYWDGGLFDNTPLGALLSRIHKDDAATTRVIVVNLFPSAGAVPLNMLQVFDRMIELQFANKTQKDVELAQTINKLILAIEQLQGVPAHDENSVLHRSGFEDLLKYKVFDNIVPITNNASEDASSSADFSKAGIQRRIEAGYRDAAAALANAPKTASELKQVISA
jgi:predicted acylesterase/phospholipase RssA